MGTAPPGEDAGRVQRQPPRQQMALARPDVVRVRRRHQQQVPLARRGPKRNSVVVVSSRCARV